MTSLNKLTIILNSKLQVCGLLQDIDSHNYNKCFFFKDQRQAEEQERLRKIQIALEAERKIKEEEERKKREDEENRRL